MEATKTSQQSKGKNTIEHKHILERLFLDGATVSAWVPTVTRVSEVESVTTATGALETLLGVVTHLLAIIPLTAGRHGCNITAHSSKHTVAHRGPRKGEARGGNVSHPLVYHVTKGRPGVAMLVIH